MDWQNKIASFIKQTELNLNVANNHSLGKSGANLHTFAGGQIREATHAFNDSTDIYKNSVGFGGVTQISPLPVGFGTQQTSHTNPHVHLVDYGEPIYTASSQFGFSAAHMSQPTQASLSKSHPQTPSADFATEQEVGMLKRQTMALQEQVERCLRAHHDTVKVQQEMAESIKRDLMLQRRVYEEESLRLRDVTIAEIKDECTLLKGRVLQLETGFIGSSDTVSTHVGPLRSRVEQLSTSFHSSLGALRQEMSRVRLSLDNYTASSSQISVLLPTISDVQTELGALSALAREHSASIGELRSNISTLSARVDRYVRFSTVVRAKQESSKGSTRNSGIDYLNHGTVPLSTHYRQQSQQNRNVQEDSAYSDPLVASNEQFNYTSDEEIVYLPTDSDSILTATDIPLLVHTGNHSNDRDDTEATFSDLESLSSEKSATSLLSSQTKTRYSPTIQVESKSEDLITKTEEQKTSPQIEKWGSTPASIGTDEQYDDNTWGDLEGTNSEYIEDFPSDQHDGSMASMPSEGEDSPSHIAAINTPTQTSDDENLLDSWNKLMNNAKLQNDTPTSKDNNRVLSRVLSLEQLTQQLQTDNQSDDLDSSIRDDINLLGDTQEVSQNDNNRKENTDEEENLNEGQAMEEEKIDDVAASEESDTYTAATQNSNTGYTQLLSAPKQLKVAAKVNTKILTLQKKLGFFKRGAKHPFQPAATGQQLVEGPVAPPIVSLTKQRPKGPTRRPPSPLRRQNIHV